MGRHKRTDALQGNTMQQYTKPVVLLQRVVRLEVSGDAVGTPLNTKEPSRVELLTAIQGSQVALEGKIETVAVEVNLLRAELRKVADKVKVAEGSIAELQTELGCCENKWCKPLTRSDYTCFFDHPEMVWRWLEMWDKVVRGRTEGSGGISCRASGAESPDWRTHGTGRLVDSCHRVEIQQDGTMAEVAADSVGGAALEQELVVGEDSGMT
ncbi:hypothetical protein NDU88_001061 [Pleurodeles waltl]|uniref:Uncharacterized protein n=1 Tax=Pleurodeles waltl TaxID=8319 RepID=A0AAV7SBA1_PLEWA|nr:hypothetical protein NDU88_001061 [Pleurodeles waltl]